MKFSTTILFFLLGPIWLSQAAPAPISHELEPRGDEDPREIPELIETALAIGEILNSNHERYAISGGAAMLLLGSERETGDVDVYIPRGEKRRIQRLLSSHDQRFALHGPRMHFAARKHSGKKGGVVQAIVDKIKKKPAPGATVLVPLDFGERPLSEIETYSARGVNILHPVAQIKTKCEIDRHEKDREDVTFLAKWMLRNGFATTRKEIPQCYKYSTTQRALRLAGAYHP